MKRSLTLAVLLALLADAVSARPVRELGGKIFHYDKNGGEVAEQGVGVSLDEVGLGEITNDDGVFLLPLLGGLQTGDRVTLSIDKPGWQIFEPPGGRMEIRSSDKEFVRVRLLPKGSREFLAPDRLEKLLGGLAEKAKQKEAGEAPETRSGPPRPGTRKNQRSSSLILFSFAFAADRRDGPVRDPVEVEIAAPPGFDRYIQEWAERYGFSAAEVKAEIGRWITEVKTHRDDAHGLGLAALAEGRFAEAARCFRASATVKLKGGRRDDLIDDLRLEGDAFHYAGDSRRALASYQEAHRHTSSQETPALWATTLQDVALAHGRLAGEIPPAAGAEQLAAAVEAYRQTLLVYTRDRLPRPWAMTQNNLGVALAELAARSEGKRGNDLFAAAVDAYRQALLVYTRDRLPQEWAKAQNNLAIALRARAARTEGERSAQLLAAAVEAYRQSLRVRTREQLPEDWARTQNNLGVALRDQASRAGGERGAQLLAEAVEAYRQALLVRTRERFPQQWARTQDNLGSALQDQALQTGGEAGAQLLAKAVEAFRQALLVRTYEQFPKDWAMTQNNLGAALRDQASCTEGEVGAQLLAEAVEAFQQALRVRTRENLPQQWAMTQTNLGNALRDQGLRAGGEPAIRLLTDAVEAYRDALRVRTREQLPQDWAATQVDLGDALSGLAVRAEGKPKARFFAEALRAYRHALEVFSWEHFPRQWAIARRDEAKVLLLTGGDREAAEALSEILARNPRDANAFSSLALLLSNRLFEPSRALTIIRPWLAQHPEDLTARILEVEALFASGRLADCRAKAASLRADELAARHGGAAVLLGYQIAAGLAAGSPGAAADLARLRREIAAEPPDFSTGWTFPGALHALRERPGLPRRNWLVRFFQALEAPDRDSILRQLRALEEELGGEAGKRGWGVRDRPARAALSFFSHRWCKCDPDQQSFGRQETADNLSPRFFLVLDEHSVALRFKLRGYVFHAVDVKLEPGLWWGNLVGPGILPEA